MYWDFYNQFQPNKDEMLKIYTATFKEEKTLNIYTSIFNQNQMFPTSRQSFRVWTTRNGLLKFMDSIPEVDTASGFSQPTRLEQVLEVDNPVRFLSKRELFSTRFTEIFYIEILINGLTFDLLDAYTTRYGPPTHPPTHVGGGYGSVGDLTITWMVRYYMLIIYPYSAVFLFFLELTDQRFAKDKLQIREKLLLQFYRY